MIYGMVVLYQIKLICALLNNGLPLPVLLGRHYLPVFAYIEKKRWESAPKNSTNM